MDWRAQIEGAVSSGELTVLQGQELFSKFGLDPSSLTIPCEAPGCQQSMQLGDAHSFISCYATTGPAVNEAGHRVAAFQCHHMQHYGCSVEHAAEAHARCVREHMMPEHGRRADALRQSTPPTPAAAPARKGKQSNG